MRPLFVAILILFLITFHYSFAFDYPEESDLDPFLNAALRYLDINNQGKEEFALVKITAFFRDIDINNDSKKESVLIIEPPQFFSNLRVGGEFWADDSGAWLYVFNENREVVFGRCTSSIFSPDIEFVTVEDLNNDKLKEIVIFYGQESDGVYMPRTEIYLWKDNALKLVQRIEHKFQLNPNYNWEGYTPQYGFKATSFSLKDMDNDGVKEVIVSTREHQSLFVPEKLIYKWENGSYKLMRKSK